MNKENAPCGWRDDGLPEPDPREYEEKSEAVYNKVEARREIINLFFENKFNEIAEILISQLPACKINPDKDYGIQLIVYGDKNTPASMCVEIYNVINNNLEFKIDV